MNMLQQIALKAGCSTATVSRALNKSGPVSERMARRVEKAAMELGYRPAANPVLPHRLRQKPMIGVLIPSITNPVFAASLSNIQKRARVSGHGVIIAQSDYDPVREAEAILDLVSERPVGLILTLCDPQANAANLPRVLPPTVLLHNLPTARFPASVAADNFQAGQQLCDHILDHHHSSILFVSGSFTASDRARLRYEGYCAAMRNRGLTPHPALEVGFLNGYDGLDLSQSMKLFKPTAMIASNDLLAFGVIGALRREGLNVPADISVAGFDGIPLGRLIDPPLTTIEMADASMGAAAASLLIDMTENGSKPRHLNVPHSLRIGGTVRSLAE
ncbi:DNA-binding LacI/PurR family transcriptional regulator [Agrobacterium vitis]|nr:DNA-binding LacI/PurR family transcriptional regulator [Agrobacterium vitis]MBE1437874.1 DNA-binding LacI/PurR family transcriptional regulator [Agrobacterium vitis]